MGTAVQIQNIGESCLSRFLLLGLDSHAGCQIKDTQWERAQLIMEGDKPTYIVS